MKRGPIAVMASVALVVGLVLAPDAMPAEPWRGAMTVGSPPAPFRPIVPHGFFGHPNNPRRIVPAPVPPRPFVHHRFLPFGVIGGPVVVYAPPPASSVAPAPYGGPWYYTPPVVYDQRAVYYPPAASPSSPSVIQFPTGRYELRGDGVTVPYAWVWIPDPPTAPPEPVAPPIAPMERGDISPPSRRPVYRWTDAQGVLHMTDRWESVPPEHRAQAKPPQPS